jgi:uncharacterized protein YoxC
MNKAEFVIFMTTNAAIFVAISIIVMIVWYYFLIGKTRKLEKIMDHAEKIAKNLEARIDSINKTSYAIKTYNKAIFDYIKEIRKILIKYKDSAFDSKLLDTISTEVKKDSLNDKNSFDSIKVKTLQEINDVLKRDKKIHSDEYKPMKIAGETNFRKAINKVNFNPHNPQVVDENVNKNETPKKQMYKIGDKEEKGEYLILKNLEGWKTN